MAKIEKAKIKDATQIQQLINSFADNGEMLARPLSEIYENIRDFFVVREGERVIACAAIHVSWSDLAEIKSVAVAENSQRKGIGNRLISACLKEAKALGIPKVFCLTYKADFFNSLGFAPVEKMTLPHKVWNECYRCPNFPNCDEVAMVLNLEPVA